MVEIVTGFGVGFILLKGMQLKSGFITFFQELDFIEFCHCVLELNSVEKVFIRWKFGVYLSILCGTAYYGITMFVLRTLEERI